MDIILLFFFFRLSEYIFDYKIPTEKGKSLAKFKKIGDKTKHVFLRNTKIRILSNQ